VGPIQLQPFADHPHGYESQFRGFALLHYLEDKDAGLSVLLVTVKNNQ
jgi:hypothetical protein